MADGAAVAPQSRVGCDSYPLPERGPQDEDEPQKAGVRGPRLPGRPVQRIASAKAPASRVPQPAGSPDSVTASRLVESWVAASSP